MSNQVQESILQLSIILLCCFILWGCGVYSFSGSTLPSSIKTVAVPLFEDRTAEFGIDQRITDSVIDAITNDNTLKIASRRNADSVLNGTIVKVVDTAGDYTRDEVASDFRITITIKVTFEDLKERKILWEETWTQFGIYDNSETKRDDGIDDAVEKLSTDILNRTVSEW